MLERCKCFWVNNGNGAGFFAPFSRGAHYKGELSEGDIDYLGHSPLVPSHFAMDAFQCLPALNASQGITANPDISGIGVRTAIYIQAVISVIHPLIAAYDGKVDDYEMRSLATVYLGILLPGCALLLSAIIQARTFGLSAYHAMIVLFLSWINNTSAFTFFAFISADYSEYQRIEETDRRNSGEQEVTELDREWVEADDLGKWRVLEKVEKVLDRLKLDKNGTKSTSLNRDVWELEIQQWSLWRKKKIMAMISPNQWDSLELQSQWEKEWENNKRKQQAILQNLPSGAFTGRWGELFSRKSILFTGALASTHLTLLSSFGWWFWFTLPNFGIHQECIPSIRLVFFTKSIPITSSTLRSLSKAIYIVSSLPVINIAIWMTIFFLGVLMAMFIVVPCATCVILVRDMRKELELVMVPSSATTSQPVSIEADFLLEWADRPINTDTVDFMRHASRSFFASAIITTLTVQILFITLTELTIAHNQHLIQSKEGDWTFGQTLALTLSLIPLTEVVKFLWEKRPRVPQGSGKSTEIERTGCVVEAEETMGGQESEKTREAQESGERRGEPGGDSDDLV